MKKMILAIAVVCATAFAQAATVVWSMANVYDHTGASKYTGEASLYAYAAGATVDDAILVKTLNVTAGALSTTAGKFTTDDLAAGTYQNFFFVINDGDYTFTSADKANIAIQSTSDTKIAFGNMQTATQTASNWSSVPEPTSGLLLLLGMAGIALKRKVA